MTTLTAIADRFTSIKVVDFNPVYLQGVVLVAREIHARSLYADMPMDVDKLVQQLSMSGDVAADRFFKIAVREGQVLGGFYGCVQRTFFCDALTAKDLGWWVASTSRGSAAAILLLLSFEKWAKSKGARKVMVGQTGVENIERTRKLFEHCGYELTGYNTAKSLP